MCLNSCHSPELAPPEHVLSTLCNLQELKDFRARNAIIMQKAKVFKDDKVCHHALHLHLRFCKKSAAWRPEKLQRTLCRACKLAHSSMCQFSLRACTAQRNTSIEHPFAMHAS